MPTELTEEQKKQQEWDSTVIDGELNKIEGEPTKPDNSTPDVMKDLETGEEPKSEDNGEPKGKDDASTVDGTSSAEELEPEHSEEPQYREIVHNGQVHRITEEKYLELAQKGFDYDFKVGPHARIAKLVEQYPEIAEMVDSHVRNKLGIPSAGKESKSENLKIDIKPLNEYETADEWLKDNFAAISTTMQQARAPKAQTQEDTHAQIVTMLKMHDPQGFADVFPAMKAAIPNLTITEYQRIDSDIGELLKFYDTVKEQISKKPVTPPANNPKGPNKALHPPFKIPSGKLPQKTNVNSAEKIWDLPNAKFNAAINKARGFA